MRKKAEADPVAEWDYNRLLSESARLLHDALLRGGSREMRTEIQMVFSLYDRWRDTHVSRRTRQ